MKVEIDGVTLHLAHPDRHPPMGLDKHLDTGNEMEEKGKTGQVNAGLAPPHQPIENGRKDGDRGRRVENSRNSKPDKIHFNLHLNGANQQYTVTLITFWSIADGKFASPLT